MPQQVMIDAARAAGVMSYREASRQYGEAHLRAQLVARRWQAPTKRSIVLHNGALDAEQRMWVSLLTAPPGASLHGLSAAVQDGLRGFTPDRLGLVIPGIIPEPACRSQPASAGLARVPALVHEARPRGRER